MTTEPSGDSIHLSPKRVRKLVEPYRVEDGDGFRLKHYDPADTDGHAINRQDPEALLADGVRVLADLQEKLYAQDRWAMLCVIQAMDAAGKDSLIKHVMSGVNPTGLRVTSFKAPGPEELAHDFLWRATRALPPRGHIGVFNRSHYEEVLVVRVHPELLVREHLPEELVGKHIWRERLEAIANYEKYLCQQGTVILKFFLNLSKEEQKRRFLERLNNPDKHWKFDPSDLTERKFWDSYQDAYQEAIAATAAPEAPWFVVPADHKWFTRLIVVAAMVDALHRLDLKMPAPTSEQLATLAAARAELEAVS